MKPRYDADPHKLPQHFIPVPPGLDKRLEDDQLDPLCGGASVTTRNHSR
jgi:hypothetical protein